MSQGTVPMSDLLYGVKAIAEHLGIEEKTARHRIDQRLIPTFKMGAVICATRSGLDDYFKQRQEAALKAGRAE